MTKPILHPSARDPRIVLGMSCTWWDSIDKATVKPLSQTPICPYCGGVLLEFDNYTQWYNALGSYEREATTDQTHAGYRQMVLWLRGQCYPSVEVARIAYLSRAI